MAQAKLKKSRPGKESTNKGLKKLKPSRVWCEDTATSPSTLNGTLLMTDSDGRPYYVRLTSSGANGIASWLAGKDTPNDLGVYDIIMRIFQEMGVEILECRLEKDPEDYGPSFTGARFRFRVGKEKPRGLVNADIMLNLALRANVPIYCDEKSERAFLAMGVDGKILSPNTAWKKIQKRKHFIRYANLKAVLKALEKNPKSWSVLHSLRECALPEQPYPWPTVKDRKSGGLDKLENWAKTCRGTDMEGVAYGLLGAYYLVDCCFPSLKKAGRRVRRAVKHLEEAHRLLPEDKDVAFDLATAYAHLGEKAKSISLLEDLYAGNSGTRDPKELSYVNFQNLRRCKKFRVLAGKLYKPDIKGFFSAQLQCGFFRNAPDKMACRDRKTRSLMLPDISNYMRKRVQKSAGGGRLFPATVATRIDGGDEEKQWFVLTTGKKKSFAIKLGQTECAFLEDSISRLSTGAPGCLLFRHLGLLDVETKSVVLTKREKDEIQAVLLFKRGRRLLKVPIPVKAAIPVVLDERCPLLISEDLIEEECMRGKSGKPLSLPTVKKKLLAE